MRKIATFGTVLCLGVLATTADTADERKRVEQELRNVPAPELPARAAEVVRNTPAAERSQAAVIAVETAIERNPTAGASVLAAISKAAPETRSAAAAAVEKAKSKGDKEKGRGKPEVPGNGNGNGGNDSGQGNSGNDGNSGPGHQNDAVDRDGKEVRRHEGNSRGHANGGVGHGPGPDKPGRQIPEKPHNSVLPNGKPRHYPPNPPNRPVDPPRPHKYNKPRHH